MPEHAAIARSSSASAVTVRRRLWLREGEATVAGAAQSEPEESSPSKEKPSVRAMASAIGEKGGQRKMLYASHEQRGGKTEITLGQKPVREAGQA